jgi:hypothetical protein
MNDSSTPLPPLLPSDALPNHQNEIWSRPRLALALGLAVLVVAALPVFCATFINDDATYAVVAQKLNEGGRLYHDAVDNKPPLIYATFEAIFALFGASTMAAVKLATLLVNAGALGLLFLIGRALFDRRVGAAAALLFACAQVSGVATDALAPNTEGWANFFILLSLWLALRRPAAALSVAAAGAAASVAALYRLQSVAAFAGLAWLLYERAPRRAFLWAALGALLPVLATAAWFWRDGTLVELVYWVLRHNVSYVSVGNADGMTAGKVGRIALTLASELPLLAAAWSGRALWRSPFGVDRAARGLLASQLALGLGAYQAGHRFYGHYFIQLVPFLALLGGWAIATHGTAALRRLPRLALVWVAGFAIFNGATLARKGDAASSLSAARYLETRLRTGDHILLWGGDPLVPFASGRPFASRFAFNNLLTGRAFGTTHVSAAATPASNRALEEPEAWRLFWQDLSDEPPAAIVDGGPPGFGVEAYKGLAAFVAREYLPAVTFGATKVYVRRASLRVASSAGNAADKGSRAESALIRLTEWRAARCLGPARLGACWSRRSADCWAASSEASSS